MTSLSTKCSQQFLQMLKDDFQIGKDRIQISRNFRSDFQWKISNFWDKHIPAILTELFAEGGIKAYYVGMTHYPSEPFDFARKTMLYADKIIIEEPLTEGVCEGYPVDGLLTNCKILLDLNELVDEGIAIFLPSPLRWDISIKERIKNEATSDSKKLLRQDRIIRDLKQDKTESLHKYVYLRAEVMDSILAAAAKTSSQVSTDSNIRWEHLNWKLKSDSSVYRKLNLDMKILKALVHPNAKFMGNIPLKEVLKAREEGYLLNLRETLRNSFRDISQSSDEDFEDVIKFWNDKLETEIKSTEQEFKSLRSWLSRRIKLRTSASLIAGTFFVIVASIAPIPALIGMASSIMSIESLSVGDILEWREKEDELRRKPIYLFLKPHRNSLHAR